MQRMILASTALVVFAPVSVEATDVIGDSLEQVTSITQFSDVYPTDWAYQALSNLIERYGCVAGYPNGTYRGNRAMTRFEAAALLNACLDRVTEVTDELKRLMKEFEKELAILKGRVDGLEARVGELEATQFTATTRLKGRSVFVVGANTYSGSDTFGFWSVPMAQTMNGAASFNYNFEIDLDTSFTGNDLLRTRLRAGNFQNSGFGNNYLAINTLESAFQEPALANTFAINRLFYSVPFGADVKVALGPIVRMDDPGMLGLWPSAYNKGRILSLFTFAGAPATYNFNALGAGGGFTLQRLFGRDNLRLSSSYIAVNGQFSNTNPNDAQTPGVLPSSFSNAGGLASEATSSSWTTQLSFSGEQPRWRWGVAAAYTYSRNLSFPNGTPRAIEISGPDSNFPTNSTSNVGVSAYLEPLTSGVWPSISLGWGYSSVERAPYMPVYRPRVQSWMVGLQWAGKALEGNSFGTAIGQAPFVTNSGVGTPRGFPVARIAQDSNLVWEAWYRWQLSDHIAITPAIYYAWQVGGEVGALSPTGLGTTINNLGGLMQTSFRF